MPSNFLVIRWSGMGDIIMTLPAVKWLKKQYRDCRISYLTDTAFSGIVEKSGMVDRTITIDRRGFAATDRFVSSLAGAMKSIHHLRREKIDMAFDLQGFGETAVLAYISGAPVRVGRIKGSPLRKRVYNSAINADWEKEHRTQYFVRTVAEACGSIVPTSIDPPELAHRSERIEIPAKIIGLNIGASTESRRWSEKYFFDLAKRLAAKGAAIRIFLGPQERYLTEAAHRACRINGWDFSSHQRMEPLMEALSQCSLLISNDTGPGHLAAALGLPVITLFSSGDPDNVRPLARHARWFRNKNDINQIQVADVELASRELLNATYP